MRSQNFRTQAVDGPDPGCIHLRFDRLPAQALILGFSIVSLRGDFVAHAIAHFSRSLLCESNRRNLAWRETLGEQFNVTGDESERFSTPRTGGDKHIALEIVHRVLLLWCQLQGLYSAFRNQTRMPPSNPLPHLAYTLLPSPWRIAPTPGGRGAVLGTTSSWWNGGKLTCAYTVNDRTHVFCRQLNRTLRATI